MIVFAVLGSLAAIGVLCWLLFMLAVFALPTFVGVSAGIWASTDWVSFETTEGSDMGTPVNRFCVTLERHTPFAHPPGGVIWVGRGK